SAERAFKAPLRETILTESETGLLEISIDFLQMRLFYCKHLLTFDPKATFGGIFTMIGTIL
ncbi:MAG: hypothetical protein AB1801_06555, partial [Chloroflexota bacterium]